jgi:hypothetical protein
MFNEEEKQKVQNLLDADLDDFKFWRSKNLPIKVYDFRDLMAGDEYLNSLTLCANGNIHTSFPFEDLISYFGLESRIDEVKERQRETYVWKRIDFTDEDEARLGINNRYFMLIEQFVPHKSELDEILDMKPADVTLGICASCLPLARDGYLKGLFQRVIDENRSLIINHAVPEDDYAGEEKTGLIYIVHGIGKLK